MPQKQDEKNPKRTRSSKRTEETQLQISKTDDIPFRSINTRSTPKNLVLAIKHLKQNQISWLKEIGFEWILKLNIEWIPSKLVYFAVDNLNEKERAIITSFGKIKVDEDAVTEIFGLKNQGRNVYELEVSDEENLVKLEWNSQFINEKKIRASELIEKIEKSYTVDINFKLNFIVLFINTIIETTKMGIIDTSFVKNVVNQDFDFKSINWCKYIVDVAMGSKQEWDRTEKYCVYTGPSTFLMV